MAKKEKLTPKQERFVEEYLIDLNATQAAVRAGYSAKNADKIGPELLGKTRVAEAIQKAHQALAKRTETTQEQVIEQLQADHDGAINAKQYGAAIKATELQGRHIGMFEQKIKLAGDEKEPLIVNIIHYSELKKT